MSYVTCPMNCDNHQSCHFKRPCLILSKESYMRKAKLIAGEWNITKRIREQKLYIIELLRDTSRSEQRRQELLESARGVLVRLLA